MASKSVKIDGEYAVSDFMKFLDLISEFEPSEFAQDQNLIVEYTERLEDLYKNYLKHFYSDISIYCSKKNDDDIEYIIENLLVLNLANKKNSDYRDLRVNIAKIIDHIRLIQYRAIEFDEKIENAISTSVNNYYKSIADAINNNLDKAMIGTENALKKINDTDNKLEETYAKLDDVDGRLRSINIDMIAVLSIFSAIIISFFGGLNFIGQALASMNNSNPKLTILVITISGIVMFNIIYFLFLLISKVLRVPIGFECKEDSCNRCGENCSRLKSIWNKHAIFVVVNTILVLVVIIIWFKLPGIFVERTYIK